MYQDGVCRRLPHKSQYLVQTGWRRVRGSLIMTLRLQNSFRIELTLYADSKQLKLQNYYGKERFEYAVLR